MSTIIRRYKNDDAKPILEIINYTILNSTAIYDYNVRTLETLTSLFEDKINKGFPIIVAILDKKVVGFGYFSEFRFRDGYKFTVEHSVYVDKEFQGKGIGKLLLEELIAIAKNQNRHTMIAVIDSENQSSIEFHTKFGFKTVAVLNETGFKFDRWLNSVFMQKMLV